jgi:superfamily II DNA or RNA helicase
MGVGVTVNGSLTITSPPGGLVEASLRSLKIPNPTYHMAIKKNPRARYALSEYINYGKYSERTNTLTLPRAVFDRCIRWLDGKEIRYDLRDERTRVAAALRSTIKLRDYQSRTLDITDRCHEGIFHLDTGYGKTIIALRLAEKLQQKTLIIVPKQDLMQQFKNEYEKYFPGKCGIIQGKKVKIEDITVATVQSLRNRIKDGAVPPGTFGLLVVDECHMFVTAQCREVIEHFSAFYRYGFTGTMGRSDGQIQAIEWIIGPVIARAKMDRAQPTVEVHEYPHKIFMDEYHNIIAEQVAHEERNKMIYEIALQKRREGRRVLILTKRVAHAEEIAQDTACYIFKASDAKGVRDEFLSAAKSCPDSISILMGTYALLGTGIDIPGLDTLILAGDLKSDVLLEQSAGRILRLFSDKASPVIIDIHDTGNPILRRQGRIRQEFYTSQSWDVKKISFTTQPKLLS